MNILVVYKKNFEEVHDAGLQTLKEMLHRSTGDEHHVDFKPREHVRRADFIARDLVVVFGGDGTLTSLSHNIDAATPVMGEFPPEDRRPRRQSRILHGFLSDDV